MICIGYDEGYLGIPFELPKLCTRVEYKTNLNDIDFTMNFDLGKPKYKKSEEINIVIKNIKEKNGKRKESSPLF